MEAYKYNESGKFIAVVQLQKDPLTSKILNRDIYFDKLNCTIIEPKPKTDEVAYFEGDKWKYYKKVIVYLKENQESIEIDEKIYDKDSLYYTIIVPPIPYNILNYWDEDSNEWTIYEEPTFTSDETLNEILSKLEDIEKRLIKLEEKEVK